MTAMTTSWTGAASDEFDDPANWSSGVPQPGETALITLAGTYAVTVDSSSDRSVGILQMQGDASLDIDGGLPFFVTAGTGTGALAGNIEINNGSSLVLGTDGESTTFDNTGDINLNTTGNQTVLLIGGKVTLTGGGNITLADPVEDVIGSDGPAVTLTNGNTKSGNTISGTGIIGDPTDNLFTFVNGAKGIVNADSATGLFIDPDGGTVTNSGLIEVTNGGALTVGGSLTTTVNNAGTISLGSNSLIIAGPVTLAGKGKLTLADPINSRIVSNGSFVTLTNNSTISGTGMIGDQSDDALTFANGTTGIVDANNSLGLTIGPNQNLQIMGIEYTNNGVMEATGSGNLILESSINQGSKGKVEAAGAGSTVTLADGANVYGGVVSTIKGSTLWFQDTNEGIGSAVSNAGTLLVDDGAQAIFGGAVTGSGQAKIDGSGQLVFVAAASAKVTFVAGGSGPGQLVLEDPAKFTGTVSGFAGTGSQATSDTILLTNIDFASVDTPTFSGTASGGTLTVTDGTDTDKIKLAGNYTDEIWFTAEGAFNTGTLIYESRVTSWTNTNGGTFDNNANWSNGVPSGVGDTALISATGTYNVTLTNGIGYDIGALQMQPDATLNIGADQFAVAAGTGGGALAGTIDVGGGILTFGSDGKNTTFDNTGTIDLATANNSELAIAGNVTLAGNGTINLQDASAAILDDGNTATLTNGNATSGNIITGTGSIGSIFADDPSFTNGVKGIVDATGSLAVEAANVNNDGLMKATGSGNLILVSSITQAPTGKIEAAAAGSTVTLDGDTIAGGAVSTVAGSTLEVAVGTTSQITGSLDNNGTIQVDDLASLTVAGAVTGSGQANINGGGQLAFGGAASTKVTFVADETGVGTLDLLDPAKFTGTVAGLTGTGTFATSDAIELFNIDFATVKTPTFSGTATGGTLTVTDGTHTDKIKLVGDYIEAMWSTETAGADGTFVFDAAPPSQPNPAHGAQALTQAVASFGATSGAAGSSAHVAADHRSASDFLAPPAHHG